MSTQAISVDANSGISAEASRAITEQTSHRSKDGTLRIDIPRKFVPFLKPARYKGAHGGRGSSKSHNFASMLIRKALLEPGLRAVCVREVQKSLEHSVKRLLEDKIAEYKLTGHFRVLNNEIVTPGEGLILFQGMQGHTADTIKSLEGCRVAWVEEAQTLSQYSLDLLRPTIRMPGSEIWFTWNPRHATDPVDVLLRGKHKLPEDMAIVVEVNYTDNPWLPETLKREIQFDREGDPEKFAHIWEGAYELNSEARVFKNWRVEETPEPGPGTVFYLGADWGFSVDPTVLMRMWLLDERTLVLDAEVYEVGCEINNTPDLFDGLLCEDSCPKPRSKCERKTHGWARKWEIIADNARPETISYLTKHGYPRVQPSVKGAKSVEEGIAFLQAYNIIINPRCKHAIDEFTYYSYKVDEQTNVVLPILEDKKNHVIDSARYAIEKLRHAKKRGGLIF